MPIDFALPIDSAEIKGFLDEAEAHALQMALAGLGDTQLIKQGLCVEIGSYCGKSTLYLGVVCQQLGVPLVAVDHHRGSEENQPGEDYFDPDLADGEGGMSSLALFRQTISRAGLEDTIVPVLADSVLVARVISAPLAFVFIDGGHSMPAALADYRNWGARVMAGGLLAIHDVFPDPKDGGRPPFEIYTLAMQSGLFEEVNQVKSLRILRRL